MGIPVWITVVICRFIGGFITGFLGAAVFATVLITNPAGAPAPQSSHEPRRAARALNPTAHTLPA